MNSLAHTVSSRLEQLNKAKNYAGKYEDAFVAASTSLTAAKKQQADASTDYQVICLHRFCLVN